MAEMIGDLSEKAKAKKSTLPTELKTPTVSSEIQAPALTSVALLGLNDSDHVPQTSSDFQRKQFHDKQAGRAPVYFVQFITQRLVRFKLPLEDECEGGEQATYNIIRAINMLQHSKNLSLADYKTLNIELILKAIMGDCPTARGPFSYPKPLQNDASAVLEAVNKRLPIMEEVLIETPAAENNSSSAPRAHKRRRTNNTQQHALPVSIQDMTSTLRGLILTMMSAFGKLGNGQGIR